MHNNTDNYIIINMYSLDKGSRSKISSESVPSMLKSKYQVFKTSLGTFNKFKLSLNLKSGPPRFYKARPVQFILKERNLNLKVKIDRFVSKIQFSLPRIEYFFSKLQGGNKISKIDFSYPY